MKLKIFTWYSLFILIQIIHIFTKLSLENLSLSLHTNFHMSSDTKTFVF